MIDFSWIKLVLGISVPLLLGFNLVAMVKRDDLIEDLGLSYPIGLGILGIGMFFLMLLRSLTLNNILFYVLLIWLISLVFNVRNGNYKFQSKSVIYWSRLSVGLILFLFFKIAWVFGSALIKPVVDWDATGRYGVIAKGLFFYGTYLTPYFRNRIEDYPPLIMLNQAWMFFAQGSATDLAIKVIGPMLFLSLVLVIYALLRKHFSQSVALLGSSLSVAIPFLDYHATTAYLDFSMAIFFSIGAIYLFSYWKTKNLPDLWISCLILGFGVWIKRAGIYLALVAFFWLLVSILGFFKNLSGRKKIIYPASIFMGLTSCWYLFNKLTSVHQYLSIAEPLSPSLPGQFSERFLIFINITLTKLLLAGNWNLLWLGFLLVCIFSYKKLGATHNLLGLCLLLSSLGVILFPMLFTHSFVFLQDGTVLNRITLYVVPAFTFFAVALYFEDLPAVIVSNPKLSHKQKQLKKHDR